MTKLASTLMTRRPCFPNDLREVHQVMLDCAQGCHQRALVEGRENWSGSSLSSGANEWGAQYLLSRRHLLQRIQGAIRPWYRAHLRYVLMGDPRRWHLRLVVEHLFTGRVYDQVTGDELLYANGREYNGEPGLKPALPAEQEAP